MVSQQIIDMYHDYLEDVTDGNKEAAVTLTFATIRQQTEKAIEKATEKMPETGSFGTVDTGKAER